MNWLLIVVIAIVAIAAVIGISKGVMRMLLFTAAAVCALMITAAAGGRVAGFLEAGTPIDDRIIEQIENKMVSCLEEKEDKLEGVKELPFPEFVREIMETSLSKANTTAREAIHEGSTAIGRLLFTAGVLVVLFLVSFLVLCLIASLILRAMKNTPLKTLDRIAGMLLGIVLGVILVDLLFLIITCAAMTGAGEPLMGMIRKSAVLSKLYDLNLIEMAYNMFVR